MQLTKDLSQNYTTILKEELVAAMGCTEPIAIAYAASRSHTPLPKPIASWARCPTTFGSPARAT